jgi:hypothetical protein
MLGELTTHAGPIPVQFEVPPQNPSPYGLFASTSWTESTGPSRFLMSGVDFRKHNFGGGAAFGVWDAGWCVGPDDLDPADLKDGSRPDNIGTFDPMTVWAYDECDLTAPSQAEVRARVAQNLRLLEPIAAEREFSARLLADAPALPVAIPSLVAWVGAIESEFAKTGTVGQIHAGAQWAAQAKWFGLIERNGAKLTSPLGHEWVFGGGYADGLGNNIVATSPTYGWRDQVAVRDTMKTSENVYAAVAERSLVVGYEAAVAKIATA